MQILRIDSSTTGDQSISRKLTDELLAHFTAKHPEAKVVTRDLVAEPLPLRRPGGDFLYAAAERDPKGSAETDQRSSPGLPGPPAPPDPPRIAPPRRCWGRGEPDKPYQSEIYGAVRQL